MHKEPSLSVAIGLVGLTAISGVALMAPGSSAVTSDMEVAQAAVTVSATCSMTANVNVAHTATLINGQYSGNNGNYSSGIGQTTINTMCNDPSGYSIYTVGYTDNTVGNNKLVNNALSGYDIDSGTATSGSTSNWAMKVSPVDNGGNFVPTITDDFTDGSGNPAFSTVPSLQYTKVAYLGRSTGEASQASSITTTYAAYVSPTQPAGTYAGQVAFLLVHPNSEETADDAFYAMQNVDQWAGGVKIGQQVEAMDARDGKTYWVARLCMDVTNPSTNCVAGATDADNTYSRLWMTENLDFTIDNNKTYTHGDTDLGWDPNSFDTNATWKPSVTTAVITDFSTGNPDNSVNWSGSTANNTYQAEGADTSGNEIYIYGTTKYAGIQACTTAGHTADDCKHHHVGNYYNWSAAVATNNTSSYTADFTPLPSSICPAGWRLPNGLTKDSNNNTVMSEFNQLLKAYSVPGTTLNDGIDLLGGQDVGYAPNAFTTIMNTHPLYFIRSGGLSGTTLYNFGGNGNYWSSTVNSSSSAYNLYFNSGVLYPALRYGRDLGRSLRCLSR